MPRLAFDPGFFYRIASQTEWEEAIEQNRCGFSDPTIELLQRCTKNIGAFQGPGIYFLQYYVVTVAWHGVRIRKLTNLEVSMLIDFLEDNPHDDK